MAEPRYRYGGDSAIGALLLPERREILQEEQNQFIGYDDRGQAIVQTLPAQYGESEVDFSYSPIVRGARATGSFLNDIFFGDANEQSEAAGRAVSAVRGVAGGLGDYASSQYEAGMAGGTTYDPETRQITEFDPTAVMVSGAPAGIQAARNTPSNQVIFGTMGSKTANYTPDQRRVMDELERQGMDTENLFLHGTSDDIRQPTSSRTGSRDSGFIGKGFYGATPEGSRISDSYANTAAPRFRNEAGDYSEPNVFPYITRRGNYRQYSLADKQALSKQARQDEFFGQDLAQKNIDEGFIGAEVVDADGNIIERVNYFPDTDTRSALNYDPTDLYSGGGRKISNQPEFIKSPETNASKSRETEIVMSPTEFLDLSDDLFERNVSLDSERFIKNQIEKGEPLETPFLNFDLDDKGVATVIGHEGRHRARVLEEMGIDEMPVRLRSQGRNEIRWSEQSDPNNYDRLDVPWPKLLLPQNKSSGSMVRFPVSDPLSKPSPDLEYEPVMLGDTLLYSGGGRQGSAIAGGSALRESFRIGDEGFDPRFDNRAKEQQRIADTELTYEGSPIVRPEVSIFDYEGKPFRITMADRTKAGSRITGVEGVDYDLPVELQGGQDFMFANPAGREGQVWAQDRGATSAFLNSFMGLDGKPIADEVLMLPYRMAPSGGDFSTMTGEVMVTHARNAVSKRAKQQADKTIKEFYPAWKGIDNPESIDQIREMTGDPRKSLLQVMDRDLRNEGGLGIGQARLAVSDRAQYNAPDFNLQNVGVANPYGDTRFEVSGHRTYGQGLAGRPEGILREQDINVFELMPDLVSARGFDSVDSLLRADPATLAKEQYTLRRGTRGGVITEDMLRDIESRRAQ